MWYTRFCGKLFKLAPSESTFVFWRTRSKLLLRFCHSTHKGWIRRKKNSLLTYRRLISWKKIKGSGSKTRLKQVTPFFFIFHLTLYTLMSVCMFSTDTSLYTFHKMQTRKNCSTVKSFLSWWSFLYSFPSIYTGRSQPLSRVVGYDSIIISKPCWMRAIAKFRTFSPDISFLLEVFLLN